MKTAIMRIILIIFCLLIWITGITQKSFTIYESIVIIILSSIFYELWEIRENKALGQPEPQIGF